MRKIPIIVGILVLFLAVIIASGCTQDKTTNQNQLSSLNQNSDLNAALEEAKKTNKSILIDFYASWCPACQALDEDTLSDPRVQEKLRESYVFVKIDIDQDPNLASQFKIYGVPTLVFLDTNGQETKRREGYVTPDELLLLLT